MTVAVGNDGTEPGLQAGRPTTRIQLIMSGRISRRAVWVACGLSQLLLVTAAVDGLREYRLRAAFFSEFRDAESRGWPFVWTATAHPPSFPDDRRVGYVGTNWALPVVMVVSAAALPVVAAGPIARNIRRGGSRSPAGRVELWARAILVGGLVALGVTTAELETAGIPFPEWEPIGLLDNWLDGSPKVLTPDADGVTRVEWPYGPIKWQGRAATGYTDLTLWVLFRRREYLPGLTGWDEPPAWRLRTVLTGWAMLCFGGAAAVWRRPWRAAATTPPPA